MVQIVTASDTRGQRPNESQKAVIIYMMKSVGECALLGCTLVPSMKSVAEIASEIWPVVWLFFFYHLWENLTLTFDLDLRSRSSALGSLNVSYWVVQGSA